MDAQDAREQAFRDYHASGSAPGSTLVSAGAIAAILLPIVGVVIGIVLLLKDRVGPGLGVILLSVLAMAVYYVLLTS